MSEMNLRQAKREELLKLNKNTIIDLVFDLKKSNVRFLADNQRLRYLMNNNHSRLDRIINQLKFIQQHPYATKDGIE